MSRVLDFVKMSRDKLGDQPTAEHLGFIQQAAISAMEGKSFNKIFDVQSTGTASKPRFNPADKYVKHAERAGGRDLAKITADPAKATKYMVDTIGLRGVQWGNSVSDDERKHHAAKSVEALIDLADVLGIHPRDVSIGGKLGLAIGARGRANASAHYEPDNKVINLTRASGIGTLAHEWGHAFDHWLAGHGRRYMSEESHHGQDTPQGVEAGFHQWKQASRKFRDRLRGELRDQVQAGFISEAKARTYWNSGREIFARCFEMHVQHKLADDGKKNTYLAGFAGSGGGLWPTPEETKEMSPAFDAIFAAYRQREHGSPERVKFSRVAALQELAFLMPDVLRYACKPTEAQLDAGNYRKKHIRLHALDISIETPRGQRRRPEWPAMPCDYGYIRGTVGRDKDHVDVFVGPKRRSELVVVIDQVGPDGKFDEHKVLIGFHNTQDAIETYRRAYTDDWKVGPVTTMTIAQFRQWLKRGSQNQPIERQVSRYASSSMG